MDPLAIGHLAAALALSLTFGGMTFFFAVMTPLVFTKLPPNADRGAGLILRHPAVDWTK